ncbi:M81 family metallopeptidase [Prosthecobacter sp.]|uniref:M81 family metallopeptidase n=1 Tax=Prosthecobacter sp. TaxID=1965333 RepID=UPI001DE68995|nr:M81 family metallopeptidase [Prosthecobacter sp.]MCB1276374.1 M81 family metallopeptidase [Prosthecobacter sp.]
MLRRRILIAECKQEVSTFNPHLSGYDDFGIRRGQELIDYHRTVRNEVGGALSVFDAMPNVGLVPAYSAFFITSGGTLAKTAWERIANELLDAIRTAPPVDGVYFCMHGAMASESELDPEGWLLAETRKIVGDKVPIVVSLDLHGILTDRMIEQSDAVVAYHTYPHVDFFETGQRAAKLLLRIMRGEVKPVTAKVTVPALVRGDELITATGSIRHAVNAAKEIEQSSRGLSAAIMWGNPFTDVPELASWAFVVTDNDPELAKREALRIANLFWEHHEKMRVPLKSLDEMAAIVKTHTSGTLGLVDAADATSSGASGDSNAILRKLIETGCTVRTLMPIVDEPAVKRAFAAGIGATITTQIGGTLDPQRFTPIEITAQVRLLADGRFRSESFGEEWLAGPTAVLEAGNFTLVVSSRAVNLYDRSFFYAHGQNPARFDAVVIKSPHCQPHMYADWCTQMVHVDAPGSSSANLPYLGHTRCARPMFPLDADVPFQPQAKLFTRVVA